MYPELAEWLSTSSVDVICLQEVTATPGGFDILIEPEMSDHRALVLEVLMER
jgi:hypothetical protein